MILVENLNGGTTSIALIILLALFTIGDTKIDSQSAVINGAKFSW